MDQGINHQRPKRLRPKITMKTTNDINRINENLAYIAANPTARFPNGWVKEVKAEARVAGLLPETKPVVGIACRPGIDNGIVYGGDVEGVF